MSASIPIPGREQADEVPNLAPPDRNIPFGGMSLPANRHSFNNPASQRNPTSQDDIATSWPPRPSVDLVSRSARRWKLTHPNNHKDDSALPDRSSAFAPYDYSEIASTSDKVMTAFERGTARAERPPREGVCGTYFIRRTESKNNVLCVFKPVDEEAGDLEASPSIPIPGSQNPSSLFALGAPPGLSGSPAAERVPSPAASLTDKTFSGFRAGEGAYKEVAAYLLDHAHLARVPQTALAMCSFASDLPEKNKAPSSDGSETRSMSPTSDSSEEDFNRTGFIKKKGAFQVYVENNGDAEDYGAGVFEKEQAHKIAAFDIRILNHDRHAGNILVVKSTTSTTGYDLIPIDHGYILPDGVHSVPKPVWMNWHLMKEEISSELKEYIGALDPVAEARSLNDELDGNLRMRSLRSLKIATALLQKGVAAGLSLYDIGMLIYPDPDHPSVTPELVRIMQEAEDAGDAREQPVFEDVSPTDTPYDSGVFHNVHTTGGNYRSTGCLPALPGKIAESETIKDAFIVKYATRLISEVVRRVADDKLSTVVANGSKAKAIGRVRSVPDFGLGFRPIHAMTGHYPRHSTYGESGPTPLSSPVDMGRPRPLQALGAAVPTTIRVPIDSGSKIVLPPLQPVAKTGGAPKHSMHRRDNSERMDGTTGAACLGHPPLHPGTRGASTVTMTPLRVMRRREGGEHANEDMPESLEEMVPSHLAQFFAPGAVPSVRMAPLTAFAPLWDEEEGRQETA